MSNFIEYKNIHVHYTSNGQGPAVVLLHGLLENISMWKDITPILSKKNKIITIDLLGHGKTENLGYIHTMEDQALMVKAVLSSLKLRKFILVGHSMGGYVSLAFADKFPNNTKGLCLMNSTAYPDFDEKKIGRDRLISAVQKEHKKFIRISMPMLFSRSLRDQLKEQIKHVTSEALKTSKQGIIAALEGMKIRKDRTFILKNKKIKSLIILGINDTALDLNTHIKQIEGTSAKLIQFPHGHMSHLENKEELINELLKFIHLCK